MKTASIVTILCLGMTMAPCIQAQTEEHKTSTSRGEKASGHRNTVKGVVAGVTVVGETMVDYQNKQAVTAEKDYVTIVAMAEHGEKWGDQARQQQHSTGSQAADSAKRDQDVKQTANADRKDTKSANEENDESGRWRGSARVYLIEVTPQTEVCECRDDGKKKCDLASLEIGDRVEVEFQPADMAGARSNDTRHGRHRIIRGQALSISIEQGRHDHDSSSSNQHSKDSGKEKP